jgi:hypothetical protein
LREVALLSKKTGPAMVAVVAAGWMKRTKEDSILMFD